MFILEGKISEDLIEEFNHDSVPIIMSALTL
jgi:hypothetical protein